MKQSNKITAIYLRISREDDRDGESFSIENQRTLLLEYAESNHFGNAQIFIDDGISGVTDKRKAFQEMLSLVKEDKVSTVLVKDMSRLGRNYLSVGEYVEYLFPTHDVRLIAVNDGVDTIDGVDDFMPFRNIMHEWYCKDISRKRRSTNHTLSKQGYPIGQPPYGYKWGVENPKLWDMDEEASDVVRRIYKLRLEGNSVNGIAGILKRDKILIPTVYMMVAGIRKPQQKMERGKYFWNTSTISAILKNQKYTGDVINFQTYSKSYKLKERLKADKEDWEIHKDVHQPVVDREVFEQVQRTFGNTKMRKPKDVPKHMLASYLECSDCGKKLHYKLTYPNNDNHYFSCGNNRTSKSLCVKTHHIRVDHIMEVVKQSIDGVTRFARDFEDEFVKIVVSERYKQIQLSQNKNKKKLQALKGRESELDILFEQIYEDKIIGTLSEERFFKLSRKYEDEQTELTQQIKRLQKIVASDKDHELNVDDFLKMVRKYTRINEVTPEILRHYIKKIVVHHRVETKATRTQEVEIHFNMIGSVQLPSLKEKAQYVKSFGKDKMKLSAGHASNHPTAVGRKKEDQIALAI